jgi:hypothetical protein
MLLIDVVCQTRSRHRFGELAFVDVYPVAHKVVLRVAPNSTAMIATSQTLQSMLARRLYEELMNGSMHHHPSHHHHHHHHLVIMIMMPK